MKRIVSIIGTIGAALLWPALAQAEVNYNYAQVGYAVGDLDTQTIVTGSSARRIEESYSGYTLEASGSTMAHLLFQGEYANLSLEGGQGDIRTARAGVGGHLPIDLGVGQAASVYGTVNYEKFTTWFAEGDGVGATLGLRWQASDISEFQPFIGYMDYGTVERDSGAEQGDLDGWRTGIRATFTVTDNLALSVDWRSIRLNLDQMAGAPDADLERNEELWFALRYYWL